MNVNIAAQTLGASVATEIDFLSEHINIPPFGGSEELRTSYRSLTWLLTWWTEGILLQKDTKHLLLKKAFLHGLQNVYILQTTRWGHIPFSDCSKNSQNYRGLVQKKSNCTRHRYYKREESWFKDLISCSRAGCDSSIQQLQNKQPPKWGFHPMERSTVSDCLQKWAITETSVNQDNPLLQPVDKHNAHSVHINTVHKMHDIHKHILYKSHKGLHTSSPFILLRVGC